VSAERRQDQTAEHPGRRREDQLEELLAHGSRNFRRYRRRAYLGFLLLAAATALALLQAQRAIDRQEDGRRQTTNVFCAGLSAVAEAGRATIDGSAAGLSPKFTRNLERLGYPPRREREAAARAAAAAYTRAIGQAVERESGVTGLVRANGSLDCARLRRVGAVNGH
jgi:hypothetical protein